ncbi:hypothetical protein C8J56DRAFT_140095 [Mycena floridula]|nr:hypothetical protein C8J56DRAFT_140095 [Mycena floridula]
MKGMYLPLVALTVLFSASAFADHNVTVDDTDASIVYSNGWSNSDFNNPLDYGGFHHLSENTTSTATFSFTGIAIYYMGPLWPYPVGAQVAIDSASSTLVDMQDYTRTTSANGGETVASGILFQVTGLQNGPHVLHVSFPDGKQYLALDGLIYTVQDDATSTSSSSSPTGIPSPTKSKKVLPIALGSAIGGLGLCLLLVGGCLIHQRRKRKYPSSIAGHSMLSGPPMSTAGSHVGMLGNVASPATTLDSRHPSYLSDTRESFMYGPEHPQAQPGWSPAPYNSFAGHPAAVAPSHYTASISEFGANQTHEAQVLYQPPGPMVPPNYQGGSNYQTVMEYNPDFPANQTVRNVIPLANLHPARPESPALSQNGAGIGSGYQTLGPNGYPREKAGYHTAPESTAGGSDVVEGPSHLAVQSNSSTSDGNSSSAYPREKDPERMRVMNDTELSASPGDDAPPIYQANSS